MRITLFVLFILLRALPSLGEVISLPENCFEKRITPCLLRLSEAQTLKNTDANIKLSFSSNSIVKFKNLTSLVEFEILQGKIIVQSANSKTIEFKLNEIKFKSTQIFARIDRKKILVYDAQSFILSEYDLGLARDQEMVIAKADFPTKSDMINFVSEFYPHKNELVQFLKEIQQAWKTEFKVQTDRQTKVLLRSVASSENAENQKKLKREREDEAHKKVRDLFFYRTFYR